MVRFRLDLVGERCLVAATIGLGVAWRLILSIARRSAASQVLAAAMVSGPCRSSTAARVGVHRHVIPIERTVRRCRCSPLEPDARDAAASHSAGGEATVQVIVGDRCSQIAGDRGQMERCDAPSRGLMLDRNLSRRPAARGFGAVVGIPGRWDAPQLGAHALASPARGLIGGHGGTVPGPGGGSAWRIPRCSRPGAI